MIRLFKRLWKPGDPEPEELAGVLSRKHFFMGLGALTIAPVLTSCSSDRMAKIVMAADRAATMRGMEANFFYFIDMDHTRMRLQPGKPLFKFSDWEPGSEPGTKVAKISMNAPVVIDLKPRMSGRIHVLKSTYGAKYP